MGTGVSLYDRRQSLVEEIANSVSHGMGFVAALAAGSVLVLARRGEPAHVIGASVFAVAMALVYLTSTLYHAMPHGRAKRLFRVLDHSAIFLLIAGTYTPFTLGVLRGPWGWTLFGLIWALALTGIALKTVAGVRYPRLSTALYLTMGWLALVGVKPLWARIPVDGWMWLLAGGLAYSVGVIFYATDHRVRFGHFVWHLFVLAGTACHFVAVLRYSV